MRIRDIAYLFIEFFTKQAYKPVEREEHRLKVDFAKMVSDLRKRCIQQLIEDFDINLYSYHLSVIIQRENSFENVCENPESLFLCFQGTRQAANNEIHSLTVPNQRVSLGKCTQYIPEMIHGFWLRKVLIVLIRECSLEIKLYLVKIRVRIVLE